MACSASFHTQLLALAASNCCASLGESHVTPPASRCIATHCRDAGFEPREDPERGFDHGVFVPLKLLVPDAGVPVVVLSLLDYMDPAAHLRMGRALAPLRQEGVLIVGSGGSFHSLPAMRKAGFKNHGAKHEENPQAKVRMTPACSDILGVWQALGVASIEAKWGSRLCPSARVHL